MFELREACERSFKELEEKLTTALVLTIHNKIDKFAFSIVMLVTLDSGDCLCQGCVVHFTTIEAIGDHRREVGEYSNRHCGWVTTNSMRNECYIGYL